MNITDIMTEKNIFIGLKVNGKRDLLQEIASKIAERSGFHSISTFRRAFQKCTGTIPSEYKNNK